MRWNRAAIPAHNDRRIVSRFLWLPKRLFVKQPPPTTSAGQTDRETRWLERVQIVQYYTNEWGDWYWNDAFAMPQGAQGATAESNT